MLLTPRDLRNVMLCVRPPASKASLVAPVRVRKNNARPDEAFETVDEHEARVFVQLGSKASSNVEVGLLVAWPRHHFEEQANHL
jgi:hypothetical protein